MLKSKNFAIATTSLIIILAASIQFLTPKVFAAACSTTTITVNSASSDEFIIDDDTSPLLEGAYVSYRINTGASESFNDLWVKAENFSDTSKLDLASGEDGLYHIGAMGTSSSQYVYLYLEGAATNTAQTYDLNLYDGNPNYGGVSTCTESVSHSQVTDEIQAAANKVTSVVHTAPYIGGTMTITVTGETGTMSSSRPEGSVFSYTPASVDTWPADCYELYDTHVEMTGGNTVSDDDGLIITTSEHGIGSTNTNYTITYYLVAACTTLAPTSVTPVNYISSGGTNLKHTDTGTQTYSSIPPVPPAENRIILSKSVSPGGSASGGVATYTVTVTNTSPVAVSLDIIQDSLPAAPANATYVNASSTFAGSSVANPNISGQQLTWTGNFSVPANDSKTLVYQATIPNTNGMYTNSVVAFVNSTQIDQTLDTTDNVPATATYGVGDPNLAGSTKTVSDLNGGNVEPNDTLRYTVTISNGGSVNATGVDVSDVVDSDTENVTNVVVGALGSDCGASYSNVSTATSLIVNDVDVDSGTSCVITFDVTVKSAATDNTAILNTATIGTSNEGGVGGSPSSEPLSVQLTPNLVVTKTENDADNYVTTGQVVTYTVTIDNNGDTNATGVDLLDVITGVASSVGNIVLTDCGSTYTNGSSGLNIDIANLDVTTASNCVITYDVTVDAGATNGQTVDNSANVGPANQGGNDPGSVGASTLTVGSPPTPNLSVTKTENDADNTVTPGQTVTYTVTITNSGTGTGTTSFTDSIDTDYGSPSNYSYTNCGSPSPNFAAPILTVSSLAVTTTNNCVVTYDVVVDNPSTEGTTLPNTADVAQASEGGNDPAGAAATTLTINVTPNLSTSTKTENDADNTVTPGQTITYTITVINSGDGASTGVNITDTVDTDTSLQTGTVNLTNCGTYTNNSTSSQLDITGADIAIGVNCVITFDVVVGNPKNEGTSITNSATISAASEGGSGATPSSSTLTVDATPNLSVTKTENDADNTVTPGQTVTYTVTITNSGTGTGTTSFTDSIDTDYGSPSNYSYTNCGSPSPNFAAPILTVSSLAVTTTNNCVVTYDVVVDNPSTEGTTLPNTADVAQASEGGNDPAGAAATTLTFDANDGVDAPTEAGSPNSGDANDDGLDDSEQPDVTSFVNPVTSSYAVLENTTNCINRNVSQVYASNLSANDGSYIYPVGLMDFELVCGTSGMTATVMQYYYGDVESGEIVARKYSNVTKTYKTIPGAIITKEEIAGNKVIKMVYQITDGGEFDDDGLANGTIVDPAGPAVLASKSLVNSGTAAITNLLLGLGLICSTFVLYFISKINKAGTVFSQ